MPRVTETEGNKTIVTETIDDTDNEYVRTMLQLAESRMLEAEEKAKIAKIKMHTVSLRHALQSGFAGYDKMDIPVAVLEKLIKLTARDKKGVEGKVVQLKDLTHWLAALLMQEAFDKEGLPYEDCL
jgi:hypothetical protein